MKSLSTDIVDGIIKKSMTLQCQHASIIKAQMDNRSMNANPANTFNITLFYKFIQHSNDIF